jgi:hypothetical protein
LSAKDISEFGDEGGEDEQEEIEIKEIKDIDLSEYDRSPIDVKWETQDGTKFAVLYNRMIDIFDLNGSKQNNFRS